MCNGTHAHHNWGQNSGYYIPPLLEQHRPGFLATRNEIMEQGGVIHFHGGFILPSGLIGFKVFSFHFQLDYGVVIELYFYFF